MRKSIVKLISLVLVLSTAFGLVACGSGGSGESGKTAAATAAVPEFTYSSRTLNSVTSSMSEMLAAEPSRISGEGYYAIGGIDRGELVPEGATVEYEGQFNVIENCLSYVDSSGKITVLEGYSPVVPETGKEGERDYRLTNRIEGLFLRSDGALELVEYVYASWSEADGSVKYGSGEYSDALRSDESYWIRVLETDGTERSSAKLASEEVPSLYNAVLDSEDNLLCSTSMDTGINAFNADGEIVYTIPLEGYVYSSARTRDGKAAFMVYDYEKYELSIRTVDPAAGAFDSKAYPIGFDSDSLLDGAGDYDLYTTSGSSLFGYSFEAEKNEKILSWVDCDVIGSRLACRAVCEDGSVYAVSVSSEDGKSEQTAELIKITKQPYAADNKTLISLATLYAEDSLLEAVVGFNRGNDSTRVVLKDYSEYNTAEDYSAGYTKLTTEIAAGTVPDILDVSVEMPYIQFAQRGILADLYPYIDSDSELSRSDFFENIMKAMEVDGKLCMACPGFSIISAAGSSKVVGEEPGLTYEEYYEALASMPEGCDGFDLGMTKENALTMALALDISDFMNWTTGECSFDSEEFCRLLEFCNSFADAVTPELYETGSEDSLSARISSGRQMLTQAALSSVNYMFEDYDQMFGGTATLCGYPTSHGVGNMITTLNGLAITNACRDKDAAWQFVRIMLTEKYQKTIYSIPTNKNLFEEQLANAMLVKYKTDANGNFLLDENGERIPQALGMYSNGSEIVYIYSMSEHQAQMLRDCIADSDRLLNFDQSIIKIVTEGAQAYFAGQKSVEETAKLIQSKASLYINEQK